MAYFTSEKFHIVKGTLSQYGFELKGTTEYVAREGRQLGFGRFLGRLLVYEEATCHEVYMLDCVSGFGVTSKFAEIMQTLAKHKSVSFILPIYVASDWKSQNDYIVNINAQIAWAGKIGIPVQFQVPLD
jgi:hypothetical protein